MYDKAVDVFLPALKFVCDWFVASKMIKKLHIALFANGDILLFDKNSSNVTSDIKFSSEKMGIIHVILLTWHNKLKQYKAFKKDISEELMPLARKSCFILTKKNNLINHFLLIHNPNEFLMISVNLPLNLFTISFRLFICLSSSLLLLPNQYLKYY